MKKCKYGQCIIHNLSISLQIIGPKDRFPFLYHPGAVFWLRSVGAGAGVTVVRVSKGEAETIAESIEISETMVSDHIHTAYRDNLGKVLS